MFSTGMQARLAAGAVAAFMCIGTTQAKDF